MRSLAPGPCGSLHAFADGELPREQRPVFQRHLGRCAGCQRELEAVMMLDALAATFGTGAASAPITRELPALPARTRHWWCTLVGRDRGHRHRPLAPGRRLPRRLIARARW